MNIHRIVTILDRPNRPQTALKRTLRICSDMEAPPAVLPVSFVNTTLMTGRRIYDAKERRTLKEQVRASYRSWLADLSKQHPQLPDAQIVWDEHVADWVAHSCADADLVVKTASGSKRVRSSSDWALLSSCPTNLLLVGHRRVRRPQTILAALDLEHDDAVHKKMNRRVLDAAATQAAISGAALHVASAVEVSPVLLDLDIVDEYSAQKRVIESARDTLDRLLAPYSVAKRARHFPVGRIGQSMADCAKQIKADLLVVGTRARPVVQSLGLGNSAQRILRKAPCDVLAVRPE